MKPSPLVVLAVLLVLACLEGWTGGTFAANAIQSLMQPLLVALK